MSKKLSIDLAYDAPIAAVSEMIADPAFREQVCDAQHALSKSVAITGTTVSIRYEQEVSGVPGFAKKVVGDAIEVHQDEVWSDDFVTGDITVTLPGKPGSIRVCLDAVFPAIPYCIDLIEGPYLTTNEPVVKAFRPKSG